MVGVKNTTVKRIKLCDRFPTGPTAEVDVWGCGSSQDSALLLELSFLREPKAHITPTGSPPSRDCLPTTLGMWESHLMPTSKHFSVAFWCHVRSENTSVFPERCVFSEETKTNLLWDPLESFWKPPFTCLLPTKGWAHKECLTLHSCPPRSLPQLSSS